MSLIGFSGSGGSGGSGGYKQTPDNLRSTDTFEGILGLAIGPLKGPVNGLKSISLDGTPIEDTSDTLNFQDTVVITADGHPGKFPQVVTPQLGAGGSPVGVNLTIGNTNPVGTPGPFVVKTVTNTGASFLDIRLVVNQLFRQDDKGIYGTTANLELQMKPVGASTWITPQLEIPAHTYSLYGQPFVEVLKFLAPRSKYLPSGAWELETNNGYLPITGKTTSPFVYELRVAVPNTGAYANKGWDVRIRLREVETLDQDPNMEKRNIAWESITAVYPEQMGDHEDWRGVAWMQIVGKASDQLTGVPEVAAIYDTKLVQVPPSTVFNPETRVYTGTVWDGSWSTSYTNDPAWVINDAISDGLSGLSLLAPGSSLNKWDALDASKWFCGQVPDGAGGYHSRYSMNLIIDQVHKADEFIQYMAGAVGGFAWDNGDGEWRMVVDKPSNALDVFTIDNIVGEFQYSHTDVDTRYNDIKLTFLNEEMDYRQDFVQVFDSPAIAQYGRKPTSIVGVGCTNRQEALRRAKLRLRTSVNETRIVNFMTNRRGKLLQQFSTILVADADLGNRTTGRVVSTSGNTITLRDPVRLEVGVSYQIRFAVKNPNYAPESTTQPANQDWTAPTLATTLAVTNSNLERGDVYTLNLASALPEGVAEYLTVALEAVNLPTTPKMYRVVDLKPSEDGEFVSITAAEVDTGKWDASDNVSPIDSILEKPPEVAPPPIVPASGKVLSLIQIPNNYTLVASWTRPPSNWVMGFQVKYRSNGGPWITAVNKTNETSVELLATPTGTYEVEVRTLDRLGRYSTPLTDSLSLDGYDSTSLTLSLTNDSATLAATNAGVVSDFTPASGSVVVLYGQLNVTAEATYSILTQSGCVGSVDAGGVYAVTAMSSDTAQMTIQATYNGVSLAKTLSLTKVRAPLNGVTGSSNALVYLYQRAATTPAAPSGTFTFTFATGVLSGGTPGAWATTIPANDGNPLWVIAATAVSSGATDTILATEFSSPVALATNGTAGMNSASLFLFLRSPTIPSVPSTTLVYTFATSLLSGTLSGWTQAVPAGTDPLYVTTATAVSSSVTDTILTSEWAPVQVMAQNGLAGVPATSGYLTNESVQLFAYANGNVASYAAATGSFKVFSGATDVSASFALSTLTNPQTLTIGYVSQTYTVTGGFDVAEDTASVTIRATGTGTFAGVVLDKVFTLSKAKGGYEIVAALPSADLFEGRMAFLTTDDKLYRYTGTEWTSAVPATDISGTIASSKMALGVGANLLTGAVPGTNPNRYAVIQNNADNVVFTAGGSGGQLLSPSFGTGFPGSGEWTTSDQGTFALHQSNGSPNTGSGGVGYSEIYLRLPTNVTGGTTLRWPAQAGKTYEYSVYTGAHRCKVEICIAWVNAAGVILGNSIFPLNNSETNGGEALVAYKRLVVRSVAPSGTIAAYLVIRKGHTTSGQSDSWLFATRPMFAETVANATEDLPYNVPGYGILHAEHLVTRSIKAVHIEADAITANEIAANAITTNEINAGAVTAAKVNVTQLSAISATIGLLRTATSGQRLEIENNQIRVYDGSNVLRVRMGIW